MPAKERTYPGGISTGNLSDGVLERIMRMFCTPPGECIATSEERADWNCVAFPLKTVPDLEELLTGKEILDFGCGVGLQAVWIAQHLGVKSVSGYDPFASPREWSRHMGIPNLTLTSVPPAGRSFDAVYSISAFEHFADPVETLREMRSYVRPGGLLIVTWAEPWWSPYGSHMGHFCRLPWVNLLFPERVVMKVRADYSPDGATRYEEVFRGLNRMTVQRWERIVSESGMEVVYSRLWPVKGIPLVTRIPVVRELLTAACTAVFKVK